MKIRFVVILLFVIIFILGCNQNGGTTYQDEGSPSNPVLVTVGVTHHGTIGSYGSSYYTFVAAENDSHTIGLTNTQSDLSWELYDSTHAYMEDCDDYMVPGPNDEIKQTSSLTNGADYYLLVDEWDYVAGTFDLTITYP